MALAKPGVHILTLNEIKVDPRLIEGEKFLKWSDQDASTGQPVTLQVDPSGYFLHWRDHNKEVHFLDVSQIRDVRTGKHARLPKDAKLREILSLGNSDLESKTVTVVYGTDFVNTSFLNFCTKQSEVAQLWHDQLLKIINNVLAANISSLHALKKIFAQIRLMTNNSGKVPVKSILKLFAQNKEDRKIVEKALDLSGLPSHKSDEINAEKLEFDDFFNFYTHLVQRKEVAEIFSRCCQSVGHRQVMTMTEFMNFVNSQRDPRLNEILYPYCNADKAAELITKYEPNAYNVERKQVSFEGFLRYLLSEENQIVSPELFDLYKDMNQPLSHYFVQSSHNTYLTGHQWTGKSSVEMYRQVLLAGCRCIELDLWDGKTKDEEPIIYHGYTLVPEILAKDVIIAIAESAFKTSEYPVILSFENHCKPRQQAKIAQYCREYFGDMLLTEPLDSHPLEAGVPMPSPESLKRKILVKNKKKHIKVEKTAFEEEVSRVVPVPQNQGVEHRPIVGAASSNERLPGEAAEDAAAPIPPPLPSGALDSEDSDSEEEVEEPKEKLKETGTVEKESKAAEEISALVNYVQAVRFHNFEVSEKKNRSYEMSSFDETAAVAALKEFPIEFVKYNKRQMSRIFPRGTRLDSSNFIPQVFWNAGCQLVALNYQTLDLPMQLNLGIFEYNRRCGYLRKPDFMCREDRTFDPFADTPVDGIVPGTVSIQILSGQFLTDRHVGLSVEVGMYGLPCDTVRRKHRTKVVAYNGICPQFTDDPFVFKQVVLPDLAVLRIALYEEPNKLIGHRVLPVKGIRPGYRHISLRNEIGQMLTFPTLFVHVKVQDYVPDRFFDIAEALANPIRYQSELEERTQKLMVYETTEEPSDESSAAQDPSQTPAELGPDSRPSSVLASVSSPNPSNSSLTGAAGPVGAAVKNAAANSASHASPGKRLKNASLRKAASQDDSGVGSSSASSVSAATSVASNSPRPSAADLLPPLESVESFLKHKAVSEKLAERDKKLASLEKKYEKELDKLKQSQQAKEDKIVKASSKPKNSKTKLVKILSDRTLDSSSSSQEVSQAEIDEKLAKIRSQYEEKISTLASEREKAKKETLEKYQELIATTVDKQMKLSQHSHVKQLQTIHERECAGVMKKLEAQAHEEIKDSKDKDKDDLIRLRNEKRSFIVKRGTEERRRLNELHEKKMEEIAKNHEEVRKTLLNKIALK